MSPQELLEEVLRRFTVLLLDEPERQEALLRQALGKYQEKAGILRRLEISDRTDAPVELPEDFLAPVSVQDSRGWYVPHRLQDAAPMSMALLPGSRHTPPFDVYYFCNLRDWPMESDLPTQCTALVADYLEALIALPNTERLRMAHTATNMGGLLAELPSAQDLRQRIADLELLMEENKACVLPCVVV